MTSHDEKLSLYAKILEHHKETVGFEGSDQQRQLRSLLFPGEVLDHNQHNVQSSGRLEGKYSVGRDIGGGGFGTVKSCLGRETMKQYALKVIHTHPPRMLSEDHCSITNEIKALAKLKGHPLIVEIIKVFFHHNNDTINIVMENVAKGSLTEYVSKRLEINPKLDVEVDTKHIIFQACQAMAYVHSQGIVHCDIKPDNILLTMDNPPVIKVADFGAAQFIGSSGFLTSTIGTTEYMAPERANPTAANGGFNDRVDSWSMGAMVLSMLMGQSHLAPLPTAMVARKLLLEEIISIQQINWKDFDGVGSPITKSGQTFTQDLLQNEPDLRMSLTDALDHTWFKGPDAVQQPTTSLGSGSILALGHTCLSEKKSNTTDTDPLTVTGGSQQSSFHQRRVGDADEDLAKAVDLRVLQKAMNGVPSTVEALSISGQAGPPQGMESQAGGDSHRPHTDINVLPESWPKSNQMKGGRTKASLKSQVAVRKPPRFQSNGNDVRGTRRSPRLQTLSQNRRKTQPSPYTLKKSGQAVSEHEHEGHPNSRLPPVKENEGPTIDELQPEWLLTVAEDLLRRYEQAKARNAEVRLIAREGAADVLNFKLGSRIKSLRIPLSSTLCRALSKARLLEKLVQWR